MWELLTCPIDHRLDSVVADVFIEAIEFCSTCNPKAIGAQPARHDLCSIIQDTNLRRSFLTFRRVQVHRDRVTLHRVDVHAISKRRGELSTARSRANDDSIDFDRLPPPDLDITVVP